MPHIQPPSPHLLFFFWFLLLFIIPSFSRFHSISVPAWARFICLAWTCDQRSGQYAQHLYSKAMPFPWSLHKKLLWVQAKVTFAKISPKIIMIIIIIKKSFKFSIYYHLLFMSLPVEEKQDISKPLFWSGFKQSDVLPWMVLEFWIILRRGLEQNEAHQKVIEYPFNGQNLTRLSYCLPAMLLDRARQSGWGPQKQHTGKLKTQACCFLSSSQLGMFIQSSKWA